jgi:hypothetical protein
MSYLDKANGWRKIVVDDQQFRWHFSAGSKNSVLKLQGAVSSGQQVMITMADWQDPIFHIFQTGQGNEPAVITPKFANLAIKFALLEGWHPDEPGQALQIIYQDKIFTVDNVNSG